MNISKLLRFLLSRCFSMGIVEEGSGAAADDVVLDEDASNDDSAEDGDQQDEGAGDESGDDTSAEGDADEVVVTIGEAQPEPEEDDKRAPEWVRDLRKQNREKDRAIRERDAEIARLKGSTGGQPEAVGEEPTLEACDFDAEKYAVALKAYLGRKAQADAEAARRQKAEDDARAAWQSKVDAYRKAGAQLKVKDFEDAEAAAQDVLNVTQQGVILDGADNPALVVYALGKNPAKAKELAGIVNPVKFAFAVAKLEKELKVQPKRSAPPPEKKVTGNVAGSTAIDNQLEKLRADARRTGDYSKVAEYNRQQRQKRAA